MILLSNDYVENLNKHHFFELKKLVYILTEIKSHPTFIFF